MTKLKNRLKYATLAGMASVCLGITNIEPDFKYSWGENIGWMNWRDADGGVQGAELQGTFLCGYIWGENVGWINLGDGTPANGTHYSNTDGSDFGVNVNTSDGDLFGLAWGENIGWINFDTSAALEAFGQHARFDSSANRFRGYVWAENVGWINFDESTCHVAVTGPQPAVSIVQWRSVRTHGATGDLAIVLNPIATGNGNSGPTVETRNGGIQKIEVDFSDAVTLIQPNDISIVGRTYSEGVMGGPVAYPFASATMIDADTLSITFPASPDPGFLPDETCYTISISSTVLSDPLSGDSDVNVRSLVGDTNFNGEVLLSDMLSTKSRVSPPQSAVSVPHHDVNVSGGNITLSDQLLIKSRISNPTKRALCP